MLILFCKLLIGHALADFSLQTDFIAKCKNWNHRPTPPPGQKFAPCWPYVLLAHGLISGGMVWVITGNEVLGAAEVALHCVIDAMKCANWTNLHVDQAMHMACRIVYVLI